MNRISSYQVSVTEDGGHEVSLALSQYLSSNQIRLMRFPWTTSHPMLSPPSRSKHSLTAKNKTLFIVIIQTHIIPSEKRLDLSFSQANEKKLVPDEE